MSEAQTASEPSKYDLLTKALSGEYVSDEEFKQHLEQPVEIPDDHLAEALRVSMLSVHKELASTLDAFRAVAERAKRAADADKEQKVMRPLGGLAILLFGRIEGYVKAVKRADSAGLLASHKQVVRFASLYEPLLEGLWSLWDARDVDGDTEEAANALSAVAQMASVAVKSEGFVTREAKREYERLSRQQKAYVAFASPGLAKRRARAKRDAIVSALGGTPVDDEQEPS